MSAHSFLDLFEEEYKPCPLEESKIGTILKTAVSSIPYVGSVFDIGLALWHLYKAKKARTEEERNKEYLYTGLCLISIIPVVGDIVGEGGKLLIKHGKVGGKLAKTGEYAVLSVAKLKRLQAALKRRSHEIKRILDALEEHENVLSEHIPTIRQVLKDFEEGKTTWLQSQADNIKDPANDVQSIIGNKKFKGRKIVAAPRWQFRQKNRKLQREGDVSFKCGNCGQRTWASPITWARSPSFKKSIATASCNNCNHYNVFPKHVIDTPNKKDKFVRKNQQMSLLMKGDPSRREGFI